MKKKLILALMTVAAVSVAHAQDATSPSASPTPAPKADKAAKKKKAKKKHKTPEAEVQKSNVDVPTGAGVGEGARVDVEGVKGAGGSETVIQNTNPDVTAKSTTNPPKTGSIDDEITNKKLRASTGSLSKFSFQSAITYSGSSVHKPFDSDRPDLSPGTINPQPVSLAATISGKYRLTEHDNINIGAGLNWVNPFHGEPVSGAKSTSYDHLEASDPYVAYSRLFKAWGIQNVFNSQIAYYTDKVSTGNNDTAESLLEHTLLYGIGKTGVEVGLDFDWSHEFYSKRTITPSGKIQNLGVDSLQVFPFLEYEFVKNFSFRTVYWGLRYYNMQDSKMTFEHDTVAQSAGIGISVTRDIYLYPNIQWNWEHEATWRKTNIAIAANINVF